MSIDLGAVILVLAFGAALYALIRNKERANQQWLSERRAAICLQFQQVQVTANDPRFALNGNSAEVILDMENRTRTEGTVAHFSVTRYVRNEYGEYFALISTEAAPYVKHMSHQAAKQVLKSKYRPPSNDA